MSISIKAQFLQAAKDGDLEAVKYLQKEEGVINAADEKGQTALILASQNGFLAISEELIKAGATINTKDHFDDTALIYACGIGNNEIVKALINAGADINVRDKNGETALMWAALAGQKEIIKTLMASGALPTLTNNTGKTAVELAKDIDTEVLLSSFVESSATLAFMKEMEKAVIDEELTINVAYVNAMVKIIKTLSSKKAFAYMIAIEPGTDVDAALEKAASKLKEGPKKMPLPLFTKNFVKEFCAAPGIKAVNLLFTLRMLNIYLIREVSGRFLFDE